MTRRILLSLGVLFLVLAGGAAVLVARFDPDSLKPRIADAVRRATGRELAIAGPIHVAWSLVPTVVAEDVRLANPPGLSRPDLLTAARVEVRLALLPLLSRRLELRRVRLVQPDLLLERDAAGRPNWRPDQPPPAATRGSSAPKASAATLVVLQELRIENGRLAVRSGAGATRVVPGPSVARAMTVALNGESPPQAHLAEQDGLPVPSNPVLRDLTATARFEGGSLAELHASVGASDLAPGLRLDRLTVAAASPSSPLAVDGALQLYGAPVHLSGTLGQMRALLADEPLPFDLRATAPGGATASLAGALAEPWALNGLSAALALRVPDLAALAPDARLPQLHDLAFDSRLTSPAGLAAGIALGGLQIAAREGDLAGELAVAWAPRPSLTAALASRRIDLTAVRIAPLPAAPVSATPPAELPPAPPQHAPAAPPARVFTDAPFPFARLHGIDADLRLTLAELVLPGTAVHALETRLLLQGGRLRIDPFGVVLPGGPVSGAATLDDSAPTPHAALQLRSPGIELGPLLVALGQPPGAAGALEWELDLLASGASPHALASTLGGHFGASLVDGALDGPLVAALLGDALRRANLPVELGGRVTLRCLAVRAEAAAGVATLRALLLDSSRLRLEGSGAVDLGAETLDLKLRPLLRLAGAGIELPVHVGGSLSAPRVALDAGASGRIAAAIGALGAKSGDPCAADLVVARGGRPGPEPAAAEPARPVDPADLLRNLLR